MKTKDGIQLRPIPTSPNQDYMAGMDGRVYSRTKYKGFGRKVYVDWYALKGHVSAKGYPTISLCHEGKKITKSVHKLVCMAFHGLPPTPTHQVRHLDGIPANTNPKNLCWGTQAENWADRRIHGTASVGEKHWASKLTNEERRHLVWAIQNGLCSQHHAAKALGMSQSAISSILLSKN